MRRAVTAQIRNDHPVALRSQKRRDIDITVNVVGPTMQQDHGRAIGGPGLGIAHIEQTGVDLLERRKGRVCPSFDATSRFSFARSGLGGSYRAGGSEAHGRYSQKLTARVSDFFGHLVLP